MAKVVASKFSPQLKSFVGSYLLESTLIPLKIWEVFWSGAGVHNITGGICNGWTTSLL